MIKRVINSLRPLIVVLSVFLLIGFIIFAYNGIRTLQDLNRIEAERDQWQKPAEILQLLELKPRNTVADVGCGSGYFALKLASIVGAEGAVYAEDIRNLPLMVLWFRKLIRGKRSIRLALGSTDDPHLPAASFDAILLANTYHELNNPIPILERLFLSLKAGGRIVVVDPTRSENGEWPLASGQKDLRAGGFEIVRSDDHFLEQPGRGPWWLIVARKP